LIQIYLVPAFSKPQIKEVNPASLKKLAEVKTGSDEYNNATDIKARTII
jgi:hypothetical protein